MMVHGLQRVGIDTRAVSLAAATSHALLTDPDARVPEMVLRRVWREAARHSDDPYLGLHTGEQAGAPLNNALMYIILMSRDLEDGLRRAVRFQSLMAHGRDIFRIRRDGDAIVLVLPDLQGAPGETSRHEVEFTMVVVARFIDFALQSDQWRRAVHFAHPLAAERAEYERIFQCRARFSQRENGFVIPRDVMRQPCAHHSAELLRVLEADSEQAMRRLDEHTLTSQVRAVVSARLGNGGCDVASVAATLHLSVRTLQRRLHTEHTSFDGIADDARRKIALELVTGDVVLSDLGRRLGFSDGRAFLRAFRRWTGATPTAYRAAAIPQAAS
jgi:AraC-like DNA-binding protein